MYWVLRQNPHIDGAADVAETPRELGPFRIMTGQPLKAPPSEIRLSLSENSGLYRGDILGPIAPLFSDRLQQILTSFPVDNIEYIPTVLVDHQHEREERGYSVANILGLVSCTVDDSLSLPPLQRPIPLERFAIDLTKTYELPLFRLAESPADILVSTPLRDHLLANGVRGVMLTPTEAFTVATSPFDTTWHSPV